MVSIVRLVMVRIWLCISRGVRCRFDVLSSALLLCGDDVGFVVGWGVVL